MAKRWLLVASVLGVAFGALGTHFLLDVANGRSRHVDTSALTGLVEEAIGTANYGAETVVCPSSAELKVGTAITCEAVVVGHIVKAHLKVLTPLGITTVAFFEGWPKLEVAYVRSGG